MFQSGNASIGPHLNLEVIETLDQKLFRKTFSPISSVNIQFHRNLTQSLTWTVSTDPATKNLIKARRFQSWRHSPKFATSRRRAPAILANRRTFSCDSKNVGKRQVLVYPWKKAGSRGAHLHFHPFGNGPLCYNKEAGTRTCPNGQHGNACRRVLLKDAIDQRCLVPLSANAPVILEKKKNVQEKIFHNQNSLCRFIEYASWPFAASSGKRKYFLDFSFKVDRLSFSSRVFHTLRPTNRVCECVSVCNRKSLNWSLMFFPDEIRNGPTSGGAPLQSRRPFSSFSVSRRIFIWLLEKKGTFLSPCAPHLKL